jgi:hypothetical protein
MKKYLLLITTDASVPADSGDRPDAPDVDRWWSELNGSGSYITGGPLGPAADAKVVRVRRGKVQAVQGPAMAGAEVVVGLDIFEAADLEQAVQIAAGHPMAWSYAVVVWEFAD